MEADLSTINTDTVDAIMADAHKRYSKYQRGMAGRASGQLINERDHMEWWVLTSAYNAGVNVGRGKPAFES